MNTRERAVPPENELKNLRRWWPFGREIPESRPRRHYTRHAPRMTVRRIRVTSFSRRRISILGPVISNE